MSRSLYARLHRRFGPRLSGAEHQARVRNHVDKARAALRLDAMAATAPRAGGPRVIVVGGGFAGMMAAYRLSFTCQVTVIEARDRFGGRVWTLKDGDGRMIEGGAELIGYNHALWLAMAEQFELGLSVLTSEDDYAAMNLELPMRLMGRDIPAAELAVVYDEMTAAFNEMAYQAQDVPAETPWTAPRAAERDARPLSDWIAGLPCSELTRAAIEAQFANNNGARSVKQSYLANLALVAGGAMEGDPAAFFTQTETVRCSSGNDSLARALAAKVVENGGQCLMNSEVTGIALKSGAPQVTIDNITTLDADYVVVATTVTCWPTVDPRIPLDYLIGQGIVVKYLSSVGRRFWFAEKLAPSSVSDDYGMTWEGTDNQIGRQPELSLFAGGPAAWDAIEAAREGDDYLHSWYDRRIDQVYPAYSVNRQAEPRFMNWPLERYTLTGYSCPEPGQVTTIAPRLVQPYGETYGGRLYFAGEHTCPGFFGYMEGALQSGVRAADQILARI